MSDSFGNCDENPNLSAVAGELHHGNQNLLRHEAQFTTRRKTLRKELKETKTNTERQWEETAQLKEELKGWEYNIQKSEKDTSSKHDLSLKLVDSSEDSDYYSECTFTEIPSELIDNFNVTPDLHEILESKEKTDSIVVPHIIGERTILHKEPGDTDGTYRIKLLNRCQDIVRPYGISINNFSTSWSTGHALCALIHYHEPDLIDESYFTCTNSDVTLEYVSDIIKSLGVEFTGSLVKFFQQDHPSYVKFFTFVNTLYRALSFLE